MTVGELKELLDKYPDDTPVNVRKRVYWDGYINVTIPVTGVAKDREGIFIVSEKS